MSNSKEQITVESRVEEYLDRGLREVRDGDLETAALSFRQALALDAECARAFAGLGGCKRLEGRPEEALDHLDRALGLDPHNPDFQSERAAALADTGRRREAADQLRQALATSPRHATAQTRLAHLHELQGDIDQARTLFEGALAEEPEHVEALRGLARLSEREGHLDEATKLHRAVIARDAEDVESLLSLAILHADQDRSAEALTLFLRVFDLTPDDPRALDALVRFLGERKIQAYPRSLEGILLEAFEAPTITEDALARPVARFLRSTHSLEAVAHGVGDPAEMLEELVKTPLFLPFVEGCTVTDPQIERLLGLGRAWLVLEVDPQELGEWHLSFAAAVGLQCLRNGYLYDASAEELDYLDLVTSDIDRELATGDLPSAELQQMLLIEAMYRSPDRPARREMLAEVPREHWETRLDKVLERGVFDRAEERALHATIGKIGRLADSGWEESGCPHPWWDKLPVEQPRALARILEEHALPVTDSTPPESTLQVLVAGCGTGREALRAARRYRGCEVIGVDRRMGSLAYAARMARKYAVDNVRFLQGNQRYVRHLDQVFHVIESVSGIAELDEPALGVEALIETLSPGGVLRLSLPSARARRRTADARARMKALGMTVTPREIVRFRERVLDGLEPTLVELLLYEDFYTLRSSRELLGGTRSHHFSPAEIADIFDELDLEFLGFEFPDRRIPYRYRQRYPEDTTMTNLRTWDAFEEQMPSAFLGGYHMWCRRGGEV